METRVLIHLELVLKPVETNGFANQDTCPVLNEIPWPVLHGGMCSYPMKEEQDLFQAIDILVPNGFSVCLACVMIGIPHQYYSRFKSALQSADDLKGVIHSSTRKPMAQLESYTLVAPVSWQSFAITWISSFLRQENKEFRLTAIWCSMRLVACSHPSGVKTWMQGRRPLFAL